MSASSQNVIIGTGFMYQPETKFQKANNKKKTTKYIKNGFQTPDLRLHKRIILESGNKK